MENINVGDRVQIVKSDKKDELNKFGMVIMVADGTKFVLALDDGTPASVTAAQLKKIR